MRNTVFLTLRMNVTKMTFRFYDRTKEPANLRAFSRRVEDDASRMVIISGRRRIGRTTLAKPAFTNGPLPCRFFHISDEKTAKTNVEAFWRFNAATLGLEYFPPPAATIAGTIEFLLKQSAKTPMTVVLDEFQNAETALVTDLSVLWDKYRKDTQLLLVLTVSDGAGRSMTDDRFSPLCAVPAAN